MKIKTHANCEGHARRAQTSAVKWNGNGYVRMMFAHGALKTMQAARAKVAAR